MTRSLLTTFTDVLTRALPPRTGPQGPIAFTAIALPTHGLWLRGTNRLVRKFELLAPPGRLGSGRAELFHTVPAPLGAVKKLSDQTVPHGQIPGLN